MMLGAIQFLESHNYSYSKTEVFLANGMSKATEYCILRAARMDMPQEKEHLGVEPLEDASCISKMNVAPGVASQPTTPL